MNYRTTRREAIKHIALGAGALGAGGLMAGFPGTIVSRRRIDVVTDLAESFRRTPEATVFDVASDAIGGGADYKTLLAAVFVAGIHEIQPRPVGGKLHAVMMIESAFQLGETASGNDALRAALWSLHNFKLGQQRDEREGAWELSAAPPSNQLGLEESKLAFRTAMEEWDAEKADVAVVNLLRHLDPPAVFELVWPWSARTFLDFGHKIIYTVQVQRVLQRMDWAHAEPALRALVNGLTWQGTDKVDTSIYDQGLVLAREIPDGWLQGRSDHTEVPDLVQSLRTCDSAGAQQLAVDALRNGLAAETIWDALRLFASEIFLQRPESVLRRHLPVHPVTELNAFGYAWRCARNEQTQRMLLLQAAGWLPLWKPAFQEQYNSAGSDQRIEDLAANADQSSTRVEQVLQRRDPDDVRAYLDADPTHHRLLYESLRTELLKRASQDHQYKYLAAVFEESSLCHPQLASQLISPAITYLPTPRDEESEVSRRADVAIRNAGK